MNMSFAASCLQKGVDEKNLKFYWKWIYLLCLLLEVFPIEGIACGAIWCVKRQWLFFYKRKSNILSLQTQNCGRLWPQFRHFDVLARNSQRHACSASP